MLYKILIIIFGLSLSVYAADDGDVIDMVNKLKDNSKIENNKYKNEIETTYETMKEGKPIEVTIPSYDVFADDQSRIMNIMNLPEAKDIITDDDKSCVDPELLGDFRVFVFISSGMPDKTLKNYMRDALKFKDVLLVMRGVIGSADALKPTMNFITKLSCGKELKDITPEDNCGVSRVDINPPLFTLFGVKQVPAIVYSKLSYAELLIRANTGEPLGDDDYYIIRGDMAMSYAFEKFNESGAGTEQYLEILNGSYGSR